MRMMLGNTIKFIIIYWMINRFCDISGKSEKSKRGSDSSSKEIKEDNTEITKIVKVEGMCISNKIDKILTFL